MKKISCLLILFICTCFFVFSEEGYNGLPWGSSVEKVKEKYPDIYMDYDISRTEGEDIYLMNFGENIRAFRFINNKLYWVRVVYMDASQEKFEAIKNKIADTYGGEWWPMENKNDPAIKFGGYLIDLSNLKKDTYVEYTVQNLLNAFGGKVGESVVTTYICLSLSKEIEEATQEDVEL